MKPKREQFMYDVSRRLGVEIYVLEVGRQLFLPEQWVTGGSVETKPGALTAFTQAAIDRPDETVIWTHTHPGMSAFFSMRDEDGSHMLWRNISRPFTAVVLGQNGDRHVEEINEQWIDRHPYKPPLRLWNNEWWEDKWNRNRHDRWRNEALPKDEFDRLVDRSAKSAVRGKSPSIPRLRAIINRLETVYGRDVLLQTLDDMAIIYLFNEDYERDAPVS